MLYDTIFTTRLESKTEDKNEIQKKLYDNYSTKDVEIVIFTTGIIGSSAEG